MGLTEYECPSCGGIMEFDVASQMLSCPYCDSKIKVSDYKAPRKAEQDKEVSAQPNEWQAEELQGMLQYTCQSCGGQIIAEETEGSLSCPFCGNNIVVKEQFSGSLKPDYIIPFKYTKDQAMDAYRNYVKGKLLLPKVFSAQNHIDKIRGIYIPYWLFNGKVEGDFNYEATKIKTWSDSEYDYTETSYFDLDRSGSESFKHVPHDASNEMPDDLMESIEPFDFSEAVKFNSGYLAGFLANKYDVSADDAYPRILDRMEHSLETSMRSTVSQYDTAIVTNSHVQPKNVSHDYALYPVWILNTSWNGGNYMFAMNAQSGKFIGDLPMSKTRALVLYLLSGVGLTLISMLFWFTFLSR